MDPMRRTLLVTNDFPPVVGGIQSYLEDYAKRLPHKDLMVLASTPDMDAKELQAFDDTLPFTLLRYPTRVLLPTPDVKSRMQELIQAHDIETVWFGAAAPLGLLGAAAKQAGATRVIATTHGHEVGWSMLPGARQALQRIFRDADVVTYISDYTLGRLSPFMPEGKPTLRLPSGIDTERFSPNPEARQRLRARYRLGEAPTVVCVSRLVARKGQDSLIQAWPRVVEQIPDARLIIVGWGSYAKKLAQLKRHSPVREHIVLTGKVPYEELPEHVAIGDVFAMPCRTRGGGLDVEGLGIVFLEASAAGLPVIAGDSGGAPETVEEGVTGNVVNGRDQTQLVDTIVMQLQNEPLRQRMGNAGRELMLEKWTWPTLVKSLKDTIDAR